MYSEERLNMQVQLSQKQNSNPAFGFNLKFEEGFFEKAAKLLPKRQSEVIDSFQKIATNPEYLKDEREVIVSSNSLKVLSEKLGNARYEFQLTADSILNGFRDALNDGIQIKGLPDYAKKVSKELGINLSFNNAKTLEVGTAEQYRDSIDYAGKRLAQFPDKNDIIANIRRGTACNTSDIVMTKEGVNRGTALLFSGTDVVDPYEIGRRVESTYLDIHSKLGDMAPRELAKASEERAIIADKEKNVKLTNFTDTMQKALKIG